MVWDIAWFAIFTAVESLVLIIKSSVQEMIGHFLDLNLMSSSRSGSFSTLLEKQLSTYLHTTHGREDCMGGLRLPPI